MRQGTDFYTVFYESIYIIGTPITSFYIDDFAILFPVFNNVFIVSLLLVTLVHYSAKKKKNQKFVIRPFRSKNFLVAELVE